MLLFFIYFICLLQGLFMLLFMLFGLLLVIFLFFVLLFVDCVLQIVGDYVSQLIYDQVCYQLGFDQLLLVQFWYYLVNLVYGDFGIVSVIGQLVFYDLLVVFLVIFELVILVLIVGVVLGIVVGVLCVCYVGLLWDLVVCIFILLGNLVFIFWFGLLMLVLFYVWLQWVLGLGCFDDIYQYIVELCSGFVLIDIWFFGDIVVFKNVIGYLVLLVLVLVYYLLVSIICLICFVCLSEMNKEYILLVWVKGVGEMMILLCYVLFNICGILLMVIVFVWIFMFEGVVFIEIVFLWLGIGCYFIMVLFVGDIMVIMGGMLLIGVSFVLINNLIDLLVWLIDLRVC